MNRQPTELEQRIAAEQNCESLFDLLGELPIMRELTPTEKSYYRRLTIERMNYLRYEKQLGRTQGYGITGDE